MGLDEPPHESYNKDGSFKPQKGFVHEAWGSRYAVKGTCDSGKLVYITKDGRPLFCKYPRGYKDLVKHGFLSWLKRTIQNQRRLVIKDLPIQSSSSSRRPGKNS